METTKEEEGVVEGELAGRVREMVSSILDEFRKRDGSHSVVKEEESEDSNESMEESFLQTSKELENFLTALASSTNVTLKCPIREKKASENSLKKYQKIRKYKM